MNNGQSQKKRHPLRAALLWMSSGFIVLVGLALLEAVIHFMFPPSVDASGEISTNGIVQLLNIVSIFGGMIGVVLVPVGIVIGIVKLSKI